MQVEKSKIILKTRAATANFLPDKNCVQELPFIMH